jgi:hypothetical protein
MFDDDPFGAPVSNAPLPSVAAGFDDFDMGAPAPVMIAQPAAAPAFQAPAMPVDTPLSQWQVQFIVHIPLVPSHFSQLRWCACCFWRVQAERRQVLLKRMNKAAEAKKEQAAMARNELDKFYEERKEKISRNQAANRYCIYFILSCLDSIACILCFVFRTRVVPVRIV